MATKATETKIASASAGVWIDHKQAIVVLITGAGQSTTKIPSGIEKPSSKIAARVKNNYTRNDFVAEDKRERKTEGDRKKYFDDVIAVIKAAKSILVLGPGEAKDEFAKQLKAKKVRAAVELQTVDKMTDRQIAAKVGEHFTGQSAKKPAAGKTVPVKKAAKKATATKRTTKTAK